MFGKKRENKSKEQIAQEMRMKQFQEEQRKETERRRAIAKEVFYPILLKHAKSVRHAQQICKIFDNAIMTYHNNRLSTEALSILGLEQFFHDDKDEAHVAFREILEVFKNEKLNTCLDVIGGMSSAIDSFITQEQSARPLSDLETHFL